MSESRLNKIVGDLLRELNLNVVKEKVIDYIVRELKNGRRLSSILKDPYVKNRLSKEKAKKLIENKEALSEIEEKISQVFMKEFQFFESGE